MFLQFLRHQNKAWIKLLGILVLWLSLCTLLLIHYGLNFPSALIDSVVFSLFLLLGFMLLENIFRFYLPTKSNVILVFILPFILSLVKAQPDKAREMVLQLSDFLRGTIQKEANKWIKVEEEISFLNLFTDIEKVRFGHRLKVDFKVEEGINELKLPHLMVQPLLENAIKHSLYGLTGEVTIEVDFRKKEKNLEVIIKNPFDPNAGQAKGAGFGLEAVRRRLFLIFGRYDLLKTNALSKQFTVELLIPQLS